MIDVTTVFINISDCLDLLPLQSKVSTLYMVQVTKQSSNLNMAQKHMLLKRSLGERKRERERERETERETERERGEREK